MDINSISGSSTYQSVSSAQPAKPAKPTAPTPPPGGNIENRQAPSEPSAPTQSGSTSYGVNFTALSKAQSILGDYTDISALDSNQQKEVTSRLRDAGLLEPGSLLHVTA